MTAIKVVAIFAFCLMFQPSVCAQARDRFQDWCQDLQSARAPQLLQFLNGVTPDESNGQCVTWAIHRLGQDRYEPAIPALVKLLDFRRPKTEAEQKGFFTRVQITEEVFPAAEALEQIGNKALPSVLRAIQVASTSAIARENAVAVWMEAYKYDHQNGIARLRSEQVNSHDVAVRQRLEWAIQKALSYCAASERAACIEAATKKDSDRG